MVCLGGQRQKETNILRFLKQMKYNCGYRILVKEQLASHNLVRCKGGLSYLVICIKIKSSLI